MKVFIRFRNKTFETNVSKAMKVKEFRKKVEELTKVEIMHQKIVFGGKILDDLDSDLCGYRIQDSFTVDLIESERNVNNNYKADDSFHTVIHGDSESILNEDLELARQLNDQINSTDEPTEDYFCQQCKNNPRKKCKNCGCYVCGLKEPADKLLFCEECQYLVHLYCLPEPLDEVPDDDFYCPDCRNDPSEIVKEGEKVKTKKSRVKSLKTAKKSRDWGRGFATASRSKTCTVVSNNHFGPIPGE